MAVPTIAVLLPNTGHTGGDTLIEIDGAGFNLPPDPPPFGLTNQHPPPTMQVLFDGIPAVDVGVTDTGQLYCRTPIHDPGTVDVTVINLDAMGAPIPGETATLSSAYTFVRPDLTQKGELARVLELFLLELRRQITDNVDWAVHTDFDATTGDFNIAYMGKLPGIVLADLELPDKNPELQVNTYEVQIDANTFIERRPPIVVDAIFSLTGMSDNPLVLFNLLEATRAFFQKNVSLRVPRSPTDPTQGVVTYAMRASIGTSTKVTRQTDNSNVMAFTGTVYIEDIRLEDMPGLPTAAVSGVPAWMPHEATIRFGWTAQTVKIQKGPMAGGT